VKKKGTEESAVKKKKVEQKDEEGDDEEKEGDDDEEKMKQKADDDDDDQADNKNNSNNSGGDKKEHGSSAHDEQEEEDVPLFSLQGKKKKKKKKLDDDESVSLNATTSAASSVDGALPWEGSDRDYNYTELLERIFTLLREKNPSLSVKKKYIMPPPQLVRVGTRKTMWANFAPICQLMHRQPEHVLSFLLAELGTEGSIDGNQRCVMKGRYVPKQIESILKKYILEYVTCHMCRNPETSLTRDSVTRLYFIQCESCGSRRSVAPIKSGFHATMRTDRRKVKNEAK